MLTRWPLVLPLCLVLATPLTAQTETDLRRFFEGKRVTVKIDLPGTEQGVDIYPGADRPLDYPRYAGRLKDHGTAIEAGDDAMITRIRVKSSHIEFQLDGGGYGTMGDETSRQRRLAGGSRFNVRYRDALPPAVLTPQGLEAVLADYVAFPELPVSATGAPPSGEALAPGDSLAPADSLAKGPRLPRKGMTVAELEVLLGEPIQTAERSEGALRVLSRTYPFGEGRLTAEFVDDVLFRYSMTSE